MESENSERGRHVLRVELMNITEKQVKNFKKFEDITTTNLEMETFIFLVNVVSQTNTFRCSVILHHN